MMSTEFTFFLINFTLLSAKIFKLNCSANGNSLDLNLKEFSFRFMKKIIENNILHKNGGSFAKRLQITITVG